MKVGEIGVGKGRGTEIAYKIKKIVFKLKSNLKINNKINNKKIVLFPRFTMLYSEVHEFC